METSSCCNSVTGHQIATNFCTCHDSKAVVPCTKFCSDHSIRLEMRVKRNFHRIWNAMEKPLVKRGPDTWVWTSTFGQHIVTYHLCLLWQHRMKFTNRMTVDHAINIKLLKYLHDFLHKSRCLIHEPLYKWRFRWLPYFTKMFKYMPKHIYIYIYISPWKMTYRCYDAIARKRFPPATKRFGALLTKQVVEQALELGWFEISLRSHDVTVKVFVIF